MSEHYFWSSVPIKIGRTPLYLSHEFIIEHFKQGGALWLIFQRVQEQITVEIILISSCLCIVFYFIATIEWLFTEW